MKHINKFETHNEGLGEKIRKLGPGSRENTKGLFLGRAIDDIESKKIFDIIKKDFEKYNKDLRKVLLTDNKVSYYMGEFHPVKNAPMSGNYPDDRYKTNYTISKHEISRFNKRKFGSIEIEKITPNPNYDPSLSRKVGLRAATDEELEHLRAIDTDNEYFKISYSIAKDIYDYFNNEYIKQYPQLKDAKYKNHQLIKEIEKGEKPRLGSVDVFDMNHNEIIYPYYKVEDKEKIEKYIKNNIIVKGRNYKREPITYFTIPGEDEDLVRDNIMNMSRYDVDKQNMERLYEKY
jgi:hypothetical protein